MNALVLEWIKKTEADYHSALRDSRARKYPNYDSAGFHAQQCIEKYLKGILLYFRQEPVWGHDLLAIVEKCILFSPELELHKSLFAILTKFAVRYRYPGESATKEEAKDAIRAMQDLRKLVRSELNLST
ncbi:MAG: HEPN domain-containing protein [bacterium]